MAPSISIDKNFFLITQQRKKTDWTVFRLRDHEKKSSREAEGKP